MAEVAEHKGAILDSMRCLLAEQTGNPNHEQPFYDEFAFVDPSFFEGFSFHRPRKTFCPPSEQQPSVWNPEITKSLRIHKYGATAKRT